MWRSFHTHNCGYHAVLECTYTISCTNWETAAAASICNFVQDVPDVHGRWGIGVHNSCRHTHLQGSVGLVKTYIHRASSMHSSPKDLSRIRCLPDTPWWPFKMVAPVANSYCPPWSFPFTDGRTSRLPITFPHGIRASPLASRVGRNSRVGIWRVSRNSRLVQGGHPMSAKDLGGLHRSDAR